MVILICHWFLTYLIIFSSLTHCTHLASRILNFGLPHIRWWFLLSSPQTFKVELTWFFSVLYPLSLPCWYHQIPCLYILSICQQLPDLFRIPDSVINCLLDVIDITKSKHLKTNSWQSYSTSVNVDCIPSLASFLTLHFLSHSTSRLSENYIGFTVYPEFGYF